jgi:peptidyl-prolyl cis-trans isomerase B (cyclophilin B)
MKMKKTLKFNTILLLIVLLWSCNTKKEAENLLIEKRETIEMVTNYGTIVLELYNETPLHRDNFVKLVKENVYDSLLFHRVITNFMIQAGDTSSRNAKPEDTLGGNDLPYAVPAEIFPELYHKKGSLAAARGDTPSRESSSSQFYIVEGKVLNDSLLEIAETRINGWLAEHYIKQDSIYKDQLNLLNIALEQNDWETFSTINNNFRELAKDYKSFEQYQIPNAHRDVYKTIGGTPHLDQNYTVFGEVIKGLEVVDSIAKVKTGEFDRPIKDVRILSMRLLELEKK